MNNLNSHVLRISILVQLQQCGGNKLPQNALFAHLNAVLDFAVTEEELQRELAWLKSKAYIDFTVDELSEMPRWFITEAGKTKLPK